jgi:8-oxo-dGTP pyrophosphatase MutT (NUDIX family)
LKEAARILEVAELDFAFEPARWGFAERQASGIAAHWAALRAAKPMLYNGRVLLLGRRALETRPDGALRLSGAYFDADYAEFIAWRDFGHPGEPIDNCFSMAALRGADGAFLLGEMAAHTLNAGNIYFPAGTPDEADIFGDRVDLEASARRELFEETGVDARETSIAPGWTVVLAPPRIACMKLMTLAIPAAEAKARIDAFLERDPHAELSRIHVVAGPGDIDEDRTPDFVAAYLRKALAQISPCKAGSFRS